MSAIWNSPWTVAVIALLIAIITLAGGGFGTPAGQRVGLAIIGLLLIGFLWPPLGILLGGVALFYLVFVKGPSLIAQLTKPISAQGA
jgi:hypothetical protein